MADWVSRFSLSGKTAFVTGASSGIGEEICHVFADAGADIIAQGRRVERLEKLKEHVEQKGRNCIVIEGDLATPESAQSVAELALQRAPVIDILVNSAGVAITGPTIEFDIADWQSILAVNLTAPFVITKHLLPQMIERRAGKVINISSQAGVVALLDHTAYCTSKGGLNMLTKSFMVEFAPYNIQVNAICPTIIMTDMGKKVWADPAKHEPMLAKTPLGRFGEPVEVADMALYLASPASDLVNGEIMMIEGGFTSV